VLFRSLFGNYSDVHVSKSGPRTDADHHYQNVYDIEQKFVENADRFAFLDPFAGEFEYAEQKITFSGRASDRELVDGVVAVVKEMARDLGLLPALIENLDLWSDEYADELAMYDVNF
jgi:hypothetical protein